MKYFKTGTAPEEARMLTVLCFQAVAQGWPAAYMRQDGPLGLDGKPQLKLDVDGMMAQAADIAATLTHASDERLLDDQDGAPSKKEGAGMVDPTWRAKGGH